MTTITIVKQDHTGRETWRYSGTELERGEDYLILEAYFDREDTEFHGLFLGKGDRLVEIYYSQRWYNVFAIYDREDGRFKGWYCNVARPAKIEAAMVTYVDLALDLLVFPGGGQMVLDEDEFIALPLSLSDKAMAITALEQLIYMFSDGREEAYRDWRNLRGA